MNYALRKRDVTKEDVAELIQGLFTSPKDCFENALEKFRKEAPVSEKEQRLMLQAFSQISEIRDILSVSREKKQKTEEVWKRGQDYFKSNNFEKAYECFDSLLASELPRDIPQASLLLMAGTAALRLKNRVRALQHAEKLIYLDPKEAQAYVIKALVLMSQNQASVAIPLLLKAQQLKPQSGLIQKYLQRALGARGSITADQSSNKESQDYEKLRRWKRAPAKQSSLYVCENNGASGLIYTLPIVELSAGGCLAQDGRHLPEEFDCHLELSNHRRMWVRGKKIYQRADRMTGIRFIGLNEDEEYRLDIEVNQLLLSHRR